ncbi:MULTISPECIES: hypothetical protein [unclassified Mesorhizobium]|uniref:hypothetical protein n=1 Tax=unclassified Mesorhizobium TaxID=325217 RepID=UPI001128B8C1|nr:MULTISPECIES: hypothetical protein [unclassified Mesorhizobium]MBZ9882710.1 hypothetical protein [Mesorhizobium sp. CA10]TPJ30159.1 hypothetical protein FJ425_05370 [Mesorhizobium sp. B2-7-2]TPJ79182.1 hypothetical protein FJ419_11870 [Mesorhizobium sp. B2-6-2]
MFHDICLEAYRLGGVDAVNSLLKQQFPADADRIRAMEDLEDTGYWSISWHEKKHPDGGMYRDFGNVREYLADEGEH